MSTKLSSDELAAISQLEQDYGHIKLSLGDLMTKIMEYEERLSALELEKFDALDTYKKIQERDKELNATLQQKYGRGVIDMITGEITNQ